MSRFGENWLPLLVDALPDAEREVVTAMYWEKVSMREIARRQNWRLTSGELDTKRVARTFERAGERIRRFREEVLPALVELGFKDVGEVE